MLNYLAVGVGGAIGSMRRFRLNGMICRRFGETFPVGTLVINVSGSFLITFLAALEKARVIEDRANPAVETAPEI